MAVSEYEVENLFIERLGTIGYQFIQLRDYAEVKKNFKDQLQKFNKAAIIESKGNSELSDSEFDRLLTQIENKTVFDSAKILRDKQLLELDNGKTVYIEFLSKDTERNIYQVTHQVTMDKEHQGDVVYKNRYDVTVLINGLPLVQIELKRPGVEINEAINQINRYRRYSFRGLFRFIQCFVVSNSIQTKYFANENETNADGTYKAIGCSSNFVYKQINTILCKPLYLPQKSKIRTPVKADFIIYFSLYRGSDFDIIEAKGLCKPNLRFTQNHKNPQAILKSLVLSLFILISPPIFRVLSDTC